MASSAQSIKKFDRFQSLHFFNFVFLKKNHLISTANEGIYFHREMLMQFRDYKKNINQLEIIHLLEIRENHAITINLNEKSSCSFK